jgi:general secretion pathway protein A
MYESFWGLQQRPFENRSDASFFFASEAHQAALLKLAYAIESRRSVAVVCGDSGLGKTMLLESVIAQLPEFVAPVIRVVYPSMPADQLLRYIARQLAPHESSSMFGGIGESIETIERILRHNIGNGQHTLIAIDEAHLLDGNGSLEPLRLLLNLATEMSDAESAITLVLSGASNLLAHLSRYAALEDRVAVRCVLERFGQEQTIAYMQHRLRVAGWNKPLMFDPEALQTIQQLTLGAPRRINRLCDLSLMVGYAQDQHRIHSRIVEHAHAELTARANAA